MFTDIVIINSPREFIPIYIHDNKPYIHIPDIFNPDPNIHNYPELEIDPESIPILDPQPTYYTDDKCEGEKEGGAKPSPKFQPPTNPPQMPPENIPPDWRVREMPPTEQYPDGYWKLEKPMADGSWQPIDPSTMKPGTRPETHIPFPSQSGGE